METRKLAISGAGGRMGGVLRALVRDDARFALAAAVGRSDGWQGVARPDVVVDFSAPAGFDAALAYCVAHGVPLVSGTTGLAPAQLQGLDAAAATIAVLHAANFSLGIAVLGRAVRMAAAALPDWDLEILEVHHARKQDAPSGTALALGRIAAQARGQDFDQAAVLARAGETGPRPSGAIGFAALRAADIVGEHTVLLAGAGERLELVHRAGDRAIFARGALAAAAWIVGRPPGRYELDDVINR